MLQKRRKVCCLQFKFGSHEFEIFFGRPRNNPNRETVIIYESNGISVVRLGNLIKKPMTSVCLRNFAKIPVVRRAIQITKNGLLNLPWVIEKRDLNDKYDYKDEIKAIRNCIENPNNGDTYRTLIGAAIEDIETGDCGAIEVCRSGDFTRPIWLYPVDGFTIEYNANWNGNENTPRYYQDKKNGTDKVPLFDKDLMYLKAIDYTYSPLGTSPLESAFNVINYLLSVQEYAGTVSTNAIPKFILNLGKNLDDNKVIAFRKYFEEEIYGTGKIPIVGGSEGIQTHQLTAINDEGLYLQWQHFLTTIIAYTFGIDPKRFNEGSQTDRSTVDEQKENIIDEAIKPIAKIIEENFNKKVIGRLGLGQYLVFRYIFEDNETRKMAKTNRITKIFDSDLISRNEARELLGLPKESGKYKDMCKSEYKAAINKEYNIAGGYNGVGKNRYDNDGKGGEKKDADKQE